MFPPRNPQSNAVTGFTLVEILSALAILTVLFVLGLKVLQSMRGQADQVRCIATMRAIGAAMPLYIQDHLGELPGPMTDGQRLGYDRSASDKNHLPVLLGNYLGLPAATTEKRFAKELACDAWLRKLGPQGDPMSTPCYLMQRAEVGDIMQRVFGKATNPKEPPSRWSTISSPALQPAMIEADARIVSNYAGRVPEEPVHHPHHRNALFFDWHVARIPAEE